jgi:hypothetical protein
LGEKKKRKKKEDEDSTNYDLQHFKRIATGRAAVREENAHCRMMQDIEKRWFQSCMFDR